MNIMSCSLQGGLTITDFMHPNVFVDFFGILPYADIINSLPNDTISDWSKLKAYADDKKDVTEKLKFVLGRVENIVGCWLYWV